MYIQCLIDVGPLQALRHLFNSRIIQGISTHQDDARLVPIRLHLKEAAVVEQDPLLCLISSLKAPNMKLFNFQL